MKVNLINVCKLFVSDRFTTSLYYYSMYNTHNTDTEVSLTSRHEDHDLNVFYMNKYISLLKK